MTQGGLECAVWDLQAACVRQQCTMPCKFDEDCPSGHVCLCANSSEDRLLQFCARAKDRTTIKGRTAGLSCTASTEEWTKCILDEDDPRYTLEEEDPGCSCGMGGIPLGATVPWGLVLLVVLWIRRGPVGRSTN